MIAVDMAEGRLYHDTEIKDKLAAAQPFGDWVGKINDLDEHAGATCPRAPMFTGAELRRRQIAAGYTIEELETGPRADGRGRQGGDRLDGRRHARRRCCREKYRPLSHFFRQNFSQVTNPPIDSLREFRVMSLKTRFGNLKNVLDEDSSQTEILVLESPFVGNAAVRPRWCGSSTRRWSRSTAPSRPARPDALGEALTRIRAEAEDAVRSGAGHIVLTDQHQGRDRVPMPMILATSAVHSLADAQGAADLLLAQRALGRMHRPALLRGADRLRRDDGERLPGRGSASPTGSSAA